MIKLFAAAVTAITCMAGAIAPAARASDRSQRFAYVGNDFYVVGPDFAGYAVSSVAPVGIAPMGNVAIVPEGDQLTVDIDDALVTSGTVPVRIVQLVGSSEVNFGGCLPLRTPVTINGLVPGSTVYIRISDAFFRGSCDGGATTGVMTIGGSFHAADPTTRAL